MSTAEPPLDAVEARVDALRAAAGAEDPLAGLTAATELLELVSEALEPLVLQARARGASWRDISGAMGRQHPAAFNQFGEAARAAEPRGGYRPGPQPPAGPSQRTSTENRGRGRGR